MRVKVLLFAPQACARMVALCFLFALLQFYGIVNGFAMKSPTLKVDVKSPREAMLNIGETGALAGNKSLRIRYYRESTPQIFNQFIVGTRREVSLTNLTPGERYEVEIHPVALEGLTDESTKASFCMPAQEEGNALGTIEEFSYLELRVAKVVEVLPHPDADGLFLTKIDVGESSGPRVVVSGLAKHIKAEEFLGKLVVLLANLPPRKVRGTLSNGLILCAGNPDRSKVSPLKPPVESSIGELVTIEGIASAPADQGTSRAGQAWERVSADLCTSTGGIAMWKNMCLTTRSGDIVSGSGIEGPIR